jgi:hypothetical protein
MRWVPRWRIHVDYILGVDISSSSYFSIYGVVARQKSQPITYVLSRPTCRVEYNVGDLHKFEPKRMDSHAHRTAQTKGTRH